MIRSFAVLKQFKSPQYEEYITGLKKTRSDPLIYMLYILVPFSPKHLFVSEYTWLLRTNFAYAPVTQKSILKV